jgi:uncharacterized membrane protein
LTKTITGFGDYQVKKNALVYNVDAVPEFSNDKRCTIVTHREMICDIQGSTNFSSQVFRINPAIATTFPWLSSIAGNYEQYVIQGLVFEFKSTSAYALSSSNAALGTVIMATQYNSLSPAFTNKQQMENYEFAQSSTPVHSLLHACECDPSQTANQGLFYVNNPNDQDGDARLYDLGRFTIATQGMQATGYNLGELWVSYKICLLKPKLVGVQNVADWFQLDYANITPSLPFGVEMGIRGKVYQGAVPTPVGNVYNIALGNVASWDWSFNPSIIAPVSLAGIQSLMTITNVATGGSFSFNPFLVPDNATNVLAPGGFQNSWRMSFGFLNGVGGIGYNPNVDSTYRVDWTASGNAFGSMTNSIVINQGAGALAAVPEPATWMMLIFGFGLTGYAMRGRSSARIRRNALA